MRLPLAFEVKWFWYSMLAILSWAAWAIVSKIASRELPASTVQFLYPWGALPVMLALLKARQFKLEKNPKGIVYSLLNGLLGVLGNVAFLAAYRSGGNTPAVTATTALYPMVTVLLALLILRERLSGLQTVGVGFAVIAIITFSV
jgi:uncharacterized membrane protein